MVAKELVCVVAAWVVAQVAVLGVMKNTYYGAVVRLINPARLKGSSLRHPPRPNAAAARNTARRPRVVQHNA